ncbi:NADH-quinone oxidoreductase subunit C [Bacillus massiliigorillae]|uniref:NADH-quinone oxidoreductase subunit C n=1 Tax=Bacillus massiliigorillae TaxID=1243664 RepID=UPI00039C837F|nr:NADH-quinone oxidoreductase subunit C [Bacillus massiliigorillae]
MNEKDTEQLKKEKMTNDKEIVTSKMSNEKLEKQPVNKLNSNPLESTNNQAEETEQPKRTVEAKDTDISPEKAKAIAAAKAKAAAMAKTRTAKAKEEKKEEVLEPSHNQPLLDKYIKIIEEQIGKDALEDYYINRLSKHVPTVIVKQERYFKLATVLKKHAELQFDYLVELHGTDFVTHMEVYVYLYALSFNQPIVVKVKLDREKPTIPSLASLWEGANWPECEAYDLLGIQFENHPDLKRILLGEEWIGYPLRKDYEPHDVEV